MVSLDRLVMATDTKKENRKKVLVTAALPYINNVPHLGHIVGSHLPADIFARYCRLKGHDTLFVGGTDENGSTSEIAAKKINVPIERFSDKLFSLHKQIYDWFKISYDNFSRTNRKIHHETVQEMFQRVHDNGFITENTMKVFYSPEEDMFLPDRYVVGECPKCGYEEASGDQCESCTTVLDPTKLINPKSTVTGGDIEIRNSKHLFLRLDKLSPRLKKWVSKQKTWRSQVKAIANGWIKEGLKERCITRDLEHGVTVPIEGFKDKKIYVWFEAPIGYVSSTKEAAPERWEEFWKNGDTRIHHFLGKDNIPFHTILWPAIIMADGDNLNLPYQVAGYQYLNFEGGKFSKSKGRGVFCEKLPGTGMDPDIMRYYLTSVIPETSDSEFKWRDFQSKVNGELIGNLGNFVNRSLSFINSKLGGEIERPRDSDLTPRDKKLQTTMKKSIGKIGDYLEKAEIRKAFSEVFALSTEGNKYFEDCKPWVDVKSNKERATHVLYQCANLCRALAVVSSPFIPGAAQGIWNQLNLKGKADAPGNWENAAEAAIPERHKVNKPSILFNKLEGEYLEKLRETTANAPVLKDYFR